MEQAIIIYFTIAIVFFIKCLYTDMSDIGIKKDLKFFMIVFPACMLFIITVPMFLRHVIKQRRQQRDEAINALKRDLEQMLKEL